MRRTRIAFAVVMLFAVLALLCGCARESGESIFDSSDRFKILSGSYEGDSLDAFIIVDSKTGVQYMTIYGPYRFGITPLLNADGTPMLETGYEEQKG